MILQLLTAGGWLGLWLREGRTTTATDSVFAEHAPILRATQQMPAVDPTAHHHSPWYLTLWLTGVDYFSSLGYAPGLAVMAAGYLAPIATLLLVVVTFAAALPVYAMVAKHSSGGEGSIKMIERLTVRWGRLGWLGKAIVLMLLGFAMTDFVITITLSAADATHHVLENPLLAPFMPQSPVWLTAGLIGALCLVFLKGFKEAIGLSVAIALPYMILNAIVIGAGVQQMLAHPELLQSWVAKISAFDVNNLRGELLTMSKDGAGPVEHLSGGGLSALLLVSLVVFPKLALGMSGFETGVSVMPHISAATPQERVRNARKLLLAAAVIMCVELVGANLVATIVIPQKEFYFEAPGHPGGKAAGRALAYLAHELLGGGFGTLYDVITVLILWFAGASAMAGLLNILPRYLPRFGMSPAWLEFRRPLVLVITGVCFVVNVLFNADVEAQGSAYATGVLVLMASGAFAVMLAEWESGTRRMLFAAMLAVFGYVLVVNAAERPDGLKIAAVFIGTVIVASVWSRLQRASELRVCGIRFGNAESERLWNELSVGNDVVVIPVRTKSSEARRKSGAKNLQHGNGVTRYAFLHVDLLEDPSQFDSPIGIKIYHDEQDYVIEISNAVAVANAIAFVALRLRAREVMIGLLDSGGTAFNSLNYLLLGTGEVGYAVRAVFVRLREQTLERQFEARRAFDRIRDHRERELLRDALLMDDTDRHAATDQIFAEEKLHFEAQVAQAPHLPRLILFDG